MSPATSVTHIYTMSNCLRWPGQEGQDTEVDVQHTRPRMAIKRRRRDSIYFGEEELDEDDYRRVVNT